MMLHKPGEAAQRTITMMGGGGKMEMMERGHAGSEWMYTRNAGRVHVCLRVNGFSVKVKLY